MADVINKVRQGLDTNNLGAVMSVNGRLNYEIKTKDDDPNLAAISAAYSGHFKPPYII